MSIAFGKLIPVKVYVNNKLSSDMDTISNVTNIFCAELRGQDHYQNNYLIEQQRRMFNLGVSDYKLPKGEDAYEKNNRRKDSYVIPVNIINPENQEKERYIATGAHKNLVLDIQEEYGKNKQNGMDANKAYDILQKDLNDLKNTKGVSLDKTLYISSSTNFGAKNKKDKYQINLIDFIS